MHPKPTMSPSSSTTPSSSAQIQNRRVDFPKEGVIAALCLPADRHGRLLKPALREHMDWLRATGIHGFLALGSTGEFPLIDPEGRIDVIETVQAFADSLPVIANVSDIQPKVVVQLAHAAVRIGVSGIAVMPPLIYPASKAEQLAFFMAAAEAANHLPVLLYNFPELARNRISLDTLSTFADHANLAGIKQSGQEFSYHHELIRLARDKGFSVFSGSDTRLPEVFKMGAEGCIGGLVNLVPDLMLEQFNTCKLGLPGSEEPTASRMKQLGSLLDRLPFPLNVQAGLAARGWDPGVSRTLVSDTTQRVFENTVIELRETFIEWNLAVF